jgi:hypothetical protein
MAITVTTLTGAVIVDQNTIAVTSATGFAAGNIVEIDQERMQVQKGYPYAGSNTLIIPVLRGLEGTATQAHANAAQVKVGTSADFLGPAPQEVVTVAIGSPARERISISAAGALPQPKPGSDLDVVLNGTSVVAATLTNPTTDMDGSRLVVMGNGKAAHTVTYTTVGFGNVGTTADLITFSATQAQAIQFVACGGFWLLLGPSATATANVSGPSIA